MNKRKVRFNVFVFVLLIALLITSIVSAAPKSGPTVKLSVAQGEFDSGQDVLVTVEISNTTNHTVKILKWYTPTDGVEESLFSVMRDGRELSAALKTAIESGSLDAAIKPYVQVRKRLPPVVDELVAATARAVLGSIGDR